MMFSDFTIFMVFLCVSHHAYASESAKGTMNCAEYRSCTKCANETLCSWSLEHQNCVQPEELWGNMMVHVETDCPQFTVAKLSWLKDASYTYTLTVSNDKKDFMAYLRRVTIACSLQTGYLKGRVDQNDIKCDGIRRTQADFMLNKQMIFFYYVKFNNNSVILRLDNDSDYYVPHYNHECGVTRDDDCMTCAWTADGYINYFKRCSSANRCSGLYQFYDRRYAQNFTTTSTATAPVPLQCANASVQSVEPVSAPWTGGTVVRITVKNHRILNEKKSVVVTVAGRGCIGPKSVDNDTIACTISPRSPPREDPKAVSDVARLAEGSIVVEYGPWQKFSIVSTFAFKLVNPLLTDVSPTCGPLSGGTPLTIAGEYLDTGTAVRVVVGNDTTCTAVVRSPDRISCLTGAVETPTDGVVRVVFDGGLSAQAANRQSFAYTGNPVLDASQPFAGIVSGGTAIPVRGRHFSCARNTTMVVYLHNGTVHRTGCQIHNDTFMVCRSPTLSVDDLPTRHDTIAAENDDAEATLLGTLKFELDVAYDGGSIAKPRPGHGDPMPRYHLYADPVLDDFAMDGLAITVIGRNLEWGYAQHQGDDIVVRLLVNVNDNLAFSTKCDVTSVDWHRIVCVPKSAVNLDTVSAVDATFGLSFRRVVHRNPARPVDDSQHPWTDGRTTVVVAVFAALLLCCACLVQLYGRKIRNRYNCGTPLFELQTPE
ncbi:plexin-B2-like [Metopolophium dirhodum]|uniref:plexin-B2-like n=1 Tax=Metopolophium dirhodum TaxID=44670 RepID=UPI00298F4A6C|nr:plexin-B2-like [Metopolophium dirhodum]